jgi:type IV pilus assembly protein PilC
MAQFEYKAMDPRGRMVQGTMEAVNLADLELRLGRMGLDLIREREVRRRRTHLSARRIGRRDLIALCFHLEQLTGAGVPIIEGLADLRDTTDHPRLREVLAAMIEAIEGGATLSVAMTAFPEVFDTVMVSLVKAGEQTGELPRVLRNLTESLKWHDEQMAQVKKLLMYPALVAAVTLMVVFFLLTYLVPQLVGFIKAMGSVLPMHTQVLLWVSDLFVNYWYVVVGLPLLAGLLARYLARVSPSARLVVDGAKLRIWLVGPLLRKAILARFANYFALMYASGITVLDALRISEEIVANRAVADALARAGQRIADGAGISASFEYAGVFPPLVMRMLRVGENTGALDAALRSIGYFYTRDVQESVQRLQTLIEPTMTVVLGGLLAWVMFSVLGPIYDLVTKLKI